MHKNIELNRCPQCHSLIPPLNVPLTVVDVCEPTVVKTGKY